MRYHLITLILLLSFEGLAQFSVGSEGMTILAGTSLAVDGLLLTPSANLTLANNSIQRTSTPITGSPGINRVYQFGTPILFSGTAGLNYLTTELNGYSEPTLQLAYSSASGSPLTVTSGSTVDATNHIVSNTLTNQTLFVVTATALSDLTPILYARPTSLYGTSNFSVVVDVTELNSVASNGLITVYVTKDSKAPMTFTTATTSINGRPVQNSVWSFDNTNSSFYILTTSQSVDADGVLSFGLRGVVTPGGTKGVLTLSSIIDAGSGNEGKFNNNSDADKIEYFRQ